jgi:hypothetical protein
MLAILVLVPVTTLHVPSAAGYSCRYCLSDRNCVRTGIIPRSIELRTGIRDDPGHRQFRA